MAHSSKDTFYSEALLPEASYETKQRFQRPLWQSLHHPRTGQPFAFSLTVDQSQHEDYRVVEHFISKRNNLALKSIRLSLVVFDFDFNVSKGWNMK